jgi:hypothetical protein
LVKFVTLAYTDSSFSLANLKGLGKKRSTPAISASLLVSSLARPVSVKLFVLSVASVYLELLILLVASKPSMAGVEISMRTKSNLAR